MHLEDELFGDEKGAGGPIIAWLLFETAKLCLRDCCQLVALAVVNLPEGGLVLAYRARIVDAGDERIDQSFFPNLGRLLELVPAGLVCSAQGKEPVRNFLGFVQHHARISGATVAQSTPVKYAYIARFT